MKIITRLMLWLAERNDSRVSDAWLQSLARSTGTETPDQAVIVKTTRPSGPTSSYTRVVS